MLDEMDIRILNILQEDANLSATKISETVNLSQSGCWKRINRMKKEGYISKTVVLLDPDKVGANTIVLAHIKLNDHGREHLDTFVEAAKKIPEIVDFFCMTGSLDFFAKLIVKDVKSYEEIFFNQISKMPGVSEVQSNVVLSTIKTTTKLTIS